MVYVENHVYLHDVKAFEQDGYTDGGKQNGTTLDPAVQSGTDPKAGGRMSNGPLWIEYFADSVGATLMDFAVS